MALKLTLDQALNRASECMNNDYHWGPSTLQVMWEAYGLEDEALLWSAVNFRGGIGGEKSAACGALEGGAIALGLHHRLKEGTPEEIVAAKDAVSKRAGELVKAFREKWGDTICGELVKEYAVDDETFKAYIKSEEWEKRCRSYVRWVVEKLYEMENG